MPDRVEMPVADAALRVKNFDEVALGYTPEMAAIEASRCLGCKNPLCVQGCPVSVDIPGFIECLKQQDVAGAYAAIRKTNCLPAVCGRVCPQEEQCERNCVLGRKGQPVAIGRLERYVADHLAQGCWDASCEKIPCTTTGESPCGCAVTAPCGCAAASETPCGHAPEAGQSAAAADQCACGGPSSQNACAPAQNGCGCATSAQTSCAASQNPSSGKKVAVIGSGPAGLSTAGELASRGYSVTLFEALHSPGGVLSYGIPAFRLPKDIVQREISLLRTMGVDIVCNAVIGKSLTIDELTADGYAAIFIGSGAGLPRFMGIEGEFLNGVLSANEFLTRVNLMEAHRPDSQTPVLAARNVAVVGGGNVAMDAARCALRLGAETVSIVYRRSLAEMPARAEEVHHAEEEGVRMLCLTNPVKLCGEARVSHMHCQKMQLGEPDSSGRAQAVAIPDSLFELPADMVIMAVGTSPNPLLAQTTPGLLTDRRGCLVVQESVKTSRPSVYAGGDAVTGAATVIQAMGAGRRAAMEIDAELSALPR